MDTLTVAEENLGRPLTREEIFKEVRTMLEQYGSDWSLDWSYRLSRS